MVKEVEMQMGYREKMERVNVLSGERKDQQPFLLRRAMYIISLMVSMLIMCLYFDLIGNYNFISLILGFVACIILQINVLQYIFKK